jgi:hypothetical protein
MKSDYNTLRGTEKQVMSLVEDWMKLRGCKDNEKVNVVIFKS